ncbi:twitching motility protein PilT [Spirochaetia bacterium]|nr:twitching motility protein PilT [Spirochaetia bacterium]
MNILIDTNVALDALLERQPFYAAAANVLGLSTLGVGIFVSASAITDIYYISRKQTGSKKAAMELLKNLLLNVGAATVSSAEIHRAIALDWSDFEDAVQYAAGERLAVDYIVTRNPADFSSSSIEAVTPDQFIRRITVSSKK